MSTEELIGMIARMTKDGDCSQCGKDGHEPNPECDEHAPFEQSNDDAFDTLQSLISTARELTAPAGEPARRVFVVIEQEPDNDLPVMLKGTFSSQRKADDCVEGLVKQRDEDGDKDADQLWWDVESSELDVVEVSA